MSNDPLSVETLPPQAEFPWHVQNEPLPSTRVPHFGHALLFVSFAGLLLFLSQLILISLHKTTHDVNASAHLLMQPKRQLASMAVTYLVTLASCFLVFPIFWRRGFLAGIDWDGAKALRVAVRLISLGLCLGWSVQALSGLVPVPKSIPMDNFFRTTSDVWMVTLFGTLLAPIFEEVTFRGFLLPAFAIAFDWLGAMLRYMLAFTQARMRGEEPPRQIRVFPEVSSAGLLAEDGNLFFRSKVAVLLSSLVTSGLFALIHADQLAHAWGAVAILFGVSLVLSLIRIQTRSVACSALVHASYNFSVFLTVFLATSGYRHLEKLSH